MPCKAAPKLKIGSNFEALAHRHIAPAKENTGGSIWEKMALLAFPARPWAAPPCSKPVPPPPATGLGTNWRL